jgi:hypothetical protein
LLEGMSENVLFPTNNGKITEATYMSCNCVELTNIRTIFYWYSEYNVDLGRFMSIKIFRKSKCISAFCSIFLCRFLWACRNKLTRVANFLYFHLALLSLNISSMSYLPL